MRNKIVLSMLLIFGAFFSASQSEAKFMVNNSYGVEPAQLVICIEIGDIIIVIEAQRVATVSNGDGGVEITSVTESLDDNVHRAEFVPTFVNATTDLGDLGTVKTSLDNSRKPTTSSIQGDFIGKDFPATEDFYFYALAEKDGVTYSSETELHLRAKNVNSFPKHEGAKFELVAPVNFVAEDGTVAFTIDQFTPSFN